MRSVLLLICALASGCGSDSAPAAAATGGTGGTMDASFDGQGGAAGGKPCKGPTAADCASDEYCAVGTETCSMTPSPDGGVQPGAYDGVCTKRPDVCPTACQFMCGYDGVGYCNPCLAHKAGTEAARDCPLCPELHQPCIDNSDCAEGLLCCTFSCPYPTGCGDAAAPVTCQVAMQGQCPVNP